MILAAENFYETLEQFLVLPERIASIEEATFRRVFGQDEAGLENNIVYAFRAEKAIPRLKGKSDVIYIGQTKVSFRQRYLPLAGRFVKSQANRMKYEHIVSEYGPIRIALAPYSRFGSSLLAAEGQLLWWYFQNHCEYPPANYTKTKVRNASVSAV